MPSSRSCCKASRAPALGVSSRPMAPKSREPNRTIMDVRPASRSCSTAFKTSSPRAGIRPTPNISTLPIQTASPFTVAVTPRPIRLFRSLADGMALFSSLALPSRVIAAARGWSLKDSTATATARSSVSDVPLTGTISVIRGRPSVRVPVLSKAIAFSDPNSSSGAPPLMRTPPRAARAIPDKTALGVAMARAQGLAATSTAMAR